MLRCAQGGRSPPHRHRKLIHGVRMANMGLSVLAGRQDGLLTRRQALEHGLSDRQYHRRRSRGPWQAVLPGVVATFSGGLTSRQLRRAALLYAGTAHPYLPVLAGATAAEQHGLRAVPQSSHVEVLVTTPRHVRSCGFVVVRHTRRPDPRFRYVNGLPVGSVERSVADACRRLDRLADVRALVAESVQRGLTTTDRLANELVAGERRGSHLLSVTLAEISVGVRSAPEAEIRRIVLGTGLPEPGWNVEVVVDGVRLACGDAVWADVRLVLVDSREWHLSPANGSTRCCGTTVWPRRATWCCTSRRRGCGRTLPALRGRSCRPTGGWRRHRSAPVTRDEVSYGRRPRDRLPPFYPRR